MLWLADGRAGPEDGPSVHGHAAALHVRRPRQHQARHQKGAPAHSAARHAHGAHARAPPSRHAAERLAGDARRRRLGAQEPAEGVRGGVRDGHARLPQDRDAVPGLAVYVYRHRAVLVQRLCVLHGHHGSRCARPGGIEAARGGHARDPCRAGRHAAPRAFPERSLCVQVQGTCACCAAPLALLPAHARAPARNARGRTL